MKQLLIGIFIWILSIDCLPNYLEKAKIEENIQDKVQHVLDTMYGPHNFSVFANVEIGNESWTVSYTDRAKVKYEEEKNTPSEKYKILPGYSAIKNLSPNEAVQMPFNSKISKTSAPIIKIIIDVVTNKQFSKNDVKAADKVITNILGLDLERGDKLNFLFEGFPIHEKEEEKEPMPLESLILLGILGVSSVFFIVYILLEIQQINVNKESVKAQQETAKATAAAGASSGGSAGAPEPTPEAVPLPSAPSSGDSDVGGYFSFVGPHNAAQFMEVVKQKELPTDQIAIVASYLDPVYAKGIISQFDDAQQLEIIQSLTEEKVAEKEELDEIEEELKSQLECTVGGAAKLGPVVSKFNDTAKKTFLGSIESNQDVYKKIRPDILLFEDIEKLDDSEVKKLIGALNIEAVAASIAITDDAASKKLKSNLTGAAEAMVNQFIDLKKDSLTEQDVEKAQTQVVNSMKSLSDSGTIDIVSKIVS